MYDLNPAIDFTKFRNSEVAQDIMPARCEIDGTTFELHVDRRWGHFVLYLTVRAVRGMVPLDSYAGTVERTLSKSASNEAIVREANDMVQVLLPSTYEARKQLALAMA